MSIDAIVPVSAGAVPAVSTQSGVNRMPGDFSTWLSGEIEQTNRQILDADAEVRKLAVGEATNLHQVMMALEKAKLSFDLVVQVRNKVLEAYQDVMRMQI